VTARGQAATPLARHRHTVAAWLRRYRDGGLAALLPYKQAGAPTGQKTLLPAVFAQLKTRLATPMGLASYLAGQQWWREECGLEVPYKTLHGIVHDQRQATRKRPRPRHAKKTRSRRRTLSRSAHAAWGRSRPEAGKRPTNPCGSSARMQVVLVCTCLSAVGARATA